MGERIMKWQGNDRDGWRLEARGLALHAALGADGCALWWVRRVGSNENLRGLTLDDDDLSMARRMAVYGAEVIAQEDRSAWMGLTDAMAVEVGR